MTGEEMERAIEFVLNQQASVTTNMEKLAEAQVANERRFSRLDDNFVMLARIAEHQDSRMEQIETNVVEMSAGINKLVGAQSESNERLNVFINVLERYISGGNGAK